MNTRNLGAAKLKSLITGSTERIRKPADKVTVKELTKAQHQAIIDEHDAIDAAIGNVPHEWTTAQCFKAWDEKNAREAAIGNPPKDEEKDTPSRMETID